MRLDDVVGYTADADIYCPACAQQKYATIRTNPEDNFDHEGNKIQAVFRDSEWDYPVSCGQCHTYIHTHLTRDGILHAVNMIRTANNYTSFLLEVAEHLRWCSLIGWQQRIVEKYLDSFDTSPVTN